MNTLQNNNFFSSENQNEIYSPNINLDNNNTNNININQNQTNIIPKKKNSFLNKQIQPSREIPYFFLNDYLSDAILKFDNNEIPFHKIIISSASDFFFDYFKTIKNPYEKIEVNLPEYIKSSLRADINNKEIVENIFKYCYNNQDIKIIEEKITKNNCFNYVEIAHCLKIKSLKEHLEKIIINNFLNEENEIKICEESNLFEMKNVFKQCKENIIKNLGIIPNSKKEMTLLKYDIFRDIISSDELDVQNEKDICDLVIEYIKSRREIPEEKQDIKEIKEINNNELNKNIIQNNENLNEEEKKEENNPENQENNEEKKEENEIHEEKINEKNDIKENNENDPYNIWKKHIEELKQNSIKKRLSSEEEKNLVSCIRFSFLSHADLISLNNEPIMDNFKDLIMQGLSARLDTYENAKEKNIIINLKPRKYLKKKQEVNNPNINNNNTNTNNTNIDNKYFNTQKKEIEEENMNLNNQFNKFNDPRNFAYSQQINTNKFNNYINEDNSMNKNNMRNINNNENNREEINNYERYDENNNNNFIDNNESELNYLRAEVFNKDEIYAMNKKRNNELNSNKNISPSQSQVPYAPQDSKILKNYIDNKHQTISKKIFPVFKYTYDFDENGALYYIGTLGKKQIYCNPHELNLVTAFVGRNLVNLRTENEEFSFFGVDLGQNRKLIPTAYSIRNRNSSTHVLLCWELEGSNDKINFEILDRRIFRSDNYEMNKKLERERNLLIKPGCTSTWGISKKIREKFPEGFRYFILKQIDKNSNGSYNLTNSGFELYGDAKGNGWFFN